MLSRSATLPGRVMYQLLETSIHVPLVCLSPTVPAASSAANAGRAVRRVEIRHMIHETEEKTRLEGEHPRRLRH